MMIFLCFLSLVSGFADYSPATTERAPIVLEAPGDLMVVRVKNGRCEIYNASNGIFRRSFGSDIVQASISEDRVAAVNQQGRVLIYSASTGIFQRSFADNAVSAQIQGDQVAVMCRDGRTRIYCVSTGVFRRSF